MTNINLYQNKEEAGSKFSLPAMNKGLVFSLSLLLIVLLAIAGLRSYIPILEKQNKALVASADMEKSKLVGLKNLEQIMDLQNRLGEISKNLEIKTDTAGRLEMTKILSNLGADLITGVVVNDYKYAPEGITVKIDANNFADVAKQIIAFKTSSNFTGISINKIERSEKSITCELSMSPVKI